MAPVLRAAGATLRPGACAAGLLLVALTPGQAWAAEGLFDINAGLSFWVLVVFAILLVVLRRFAWAPILGAVNAREERIRSAIDGAAETRSQAEAILAEQREHLADARRRAGEIVAESHALAEKARAEIEAKAKVEAELLLDRARLEIARERDAALEELRTESVDIALMAASHLVSRTMDGEADKRVVERYLSEIGASS